MSEETVQQTEDSNANGVKTSRLWGIIGLAAFVVLGGIGYCPWYIWIAVILLAVMTFAGSSKTTQILFSALIIWLGTPLFSNESESYGTSDSNFQSVVNATQEQKDEKEHVYVPKGVREASRKMFE